ncbi:hypothetical protein QZH41_004595, partial [Actinostola sp. cb2023]
MWYKPSYEVCFQGNVHCKGSATVACCVEKVVQAI